MSHNNKQSEILRCVGSIFETTDMARQEMNDKTSFHDLEHSAIEINDLAKEEPRGFLAALNSWRTERIARTIENVSIVFDGPDIQQTAVNIDTTTEVHARARGGTSLPAGEAQVVCPVHGPHSRTIFS
jgi:hypothetical protein